MSEMAWLNFLRNTSLICGGIGAVIALAFLLCPKSVAAISKFLNAYHSTMSLEKILINKAARLILGFAFLVIGILMLVLVIPIKL